MQPKNVFMQVNAQARNKKKSRKTELEQQQKM